MFIIVWMCVCCCWFFLYGCEYVVVFVVGSVVVLVGFGGGVVGESVKIVEVSGLGFRDF